MEEISTSLKIIDEICKEEKIEQTLLSYGWIRELKKDGKIRHIVRNTFDLNLAGAKDIINDKYATYEVLKANNVEVLEHIMLFNPKTRKGYSKNLETMVKQALKKFNGKVVIKANNSSQGKDVFFITNKSEIIKKVNKLFKTGANGVSACPYKEIEKEYRVIYLDGQIEFIYKKEKPYIIGDGKKKLKEFIKDMAKIEIYTDLDLEYIPKNNEKIIISWKHNLSLGAIPQMILKEDKYIKRVKQIALKAGEVTNVKFASIDISQTVNGEIFVMEINGAVCMSKFAEQMANGYEITKKIYAKAISKMFL